MICSRLRNVQNFSDGEPHGKGQNLGEESDSNGAPRRPDQIAAMAKRWFDEYKKGDRSLIPVFGQGKK